MFRTHLSRIASRRFKRRNVVVNTAAILAAGVLLNTTTPVQAQDIYTWTNTSTNTAPVAVGTGNDFTNPANWVDTSNPGNTTPTVPGGYAYIDNSPGSGAVTLIQDGDTLNTYDVVTGSQATTYGIIVMTGGSLNLHQGNTSYWFRLGDLNSVSSDVSLFQMSGGTVSGVGQFRVGEEGYATVNLSAGSITTDGDMYLGDAEQNDSSLNTIAILNVTGGNLTTGGWLNIGRQLSAQQSLATMNLSGGTVTVSPTGGGRFDFGGTTDVLNMTGGTLNATTQDTFMGEQRVQDTTAVWNMSGGTANLAGLAMTVGNGGSTNFSATINLNGGTIATSRIYPGGSSNVPGTSIINFNGGTLQLTYAANIYSVFLGGLTAANVLAAGAIIDTNGSNGTITQVLASGVTSGNDGGLTKLGKGVLTLAASNTYTGHTNVGAGALDLYYTNSVLGGATPTNIQIANGAGLILGIGGANQYTTGDLTNITSHATFAGPTASIGIDTGAASLNYGGAITDSSVSGITKLGFIKAGSNTLTLSGSDTYTGPTLLSGNGTTLVGSSSALGNNSAVTLTTGAILDINGINTSIGSLASTGTRIPGETDGVNLTNANLTVGGDNTSTLYEYRIRGNGSLIKVGTGTLTLDYYDDEFTGGTTVNGGTLNLDGPGGYYGTLANTLTINPNGTVLASTSDAIGYGGAGPGIGTIVINGGSFVLAGGNEGYQTNINMTGGSISATQGGSFNFAPGFGLSTSATNSTANVSAGLQIRGGANLVITTAAGSTPSGIDLSISGSIFESEGSGSVTFAGTGTTQLSGSNTYSGGTNVNGGKVILASATALPNNASLSVAAGATVQVANHGSNTVYVPTMSSLTNNGTIDITNNALIIHNAGGQIGTINGEVAAAYNNGTWNGSNTSIGVITSSTAASDPRHLTAVGVATGLTSFPDAAVTGSDVVVKYTYYGDATLDGQVTSADYTLIDAGYLSNGTLTGWQNGDFNYDGVINGSDYTLIDNAFNTQGVSLASELAPLATATAQIAGSGATSAVPESGSLGLLAFGTLGIVRRRRR